MSVEEREPVERTLDRLATKPSPSGMRERVLGAAQAARDREAISPRGWIVAAVCLLLIVGALGADRILSKRQAEAIEAVLGRTSVSIPAPGDVGPGLQELAGLPSVELARAAGTPEPGISLKNYRDLLKGALRYEDPEILF